MITIEILRVGTGETVVSELLDLKNLVGFISRRPEDLLPKNLSEFFAEVSPALR